MKAIFIAGSRKFYQEIDSLVKSLDQKGFSAFTPSKPKLSNQFEIEKKALFDAFKLIEKSDFIYVFAKNGYIGKTVAMEMAYAYAKGKKIVASDEITELSARALVNEVITADELLNVSFEPLLQ